jgi:hypothetical protein
MKNLFLTNICELEGAQQNNGHSHQNNILTMIDGLVEFKWAFTSKY